MNHRHRLSRSLKVINASYAQTTGSIWKPPSAEQKTKWPPPFVRDLLHTEITPSGLENDRQEGVFLSSPRCRRESRTKRNIRRTLSFSPHHFRLPNNSSRLRQCKGHNDNGDISLLSNLLYISKNILIPEASRRTLALGKSRPTYNGHPCPPLRSCLWISRVGHIGEQKGLER